MTPPAASPSPSDVSVLRLSGPSDLVATVPYLLGFTPERSLVVVALRQGCRPGDAVSVVATVRLDLDDDVESVLNYYVPQVRGHGADRLVALAYPGDDGTDPLGSLAEVVEIAGHHEVDVLDTLLVRSEPTGWRWWSATCEDPCCCPAEGHHVDAYAPAVAEAVGAGLVALPSRADVEREITPDPERVRSVQAALRRLTPPAAEDRRTWQETELRWATALMHRPRLPLSARRAARLLVAISDSQVRDCLLPMPEQSSALATACWADLTRCAPSSHRAAPASLLAAAHLAEGGGVRATVAVAAALDADPTYLLAGLLQDALTHAVPPPVISQTLAKAAAQSRQVLSM